MYIVHDNPTPEKVGEDYRDDDMKMLKMMKTAQVENMKQKPPVITWIVYRPDRIPLASA